MRAKRLLPVILLLMVLVLQPAAPAGAEDPYRQIPLGLIPTEGDWPEYEPELEAGIMAALPARVDLSGYLPPVGHQGQQGSCVAWAVGYYYKGFQEAVERGWDPARPENQFSPAFVYNQRPNAACNDQNSGMSFLDAYGIVAVQGIAPITLFPYNDRDSCTQPSAGVRSAAQTYRFDGWDYINPKSSGVDLLRQLLAQGKPFLVSLPVFDNFYRITAQNPVLGQPTSAEVAKCYKDGRFVCGYHAMLVVGYDDAVGGFLTVNSWGPEWGLDGYLYLSYDFVRNHIVEAWLMHDHVPSHSLKRFQGQVFVNGANLGEDAPVAAVLDGQTLASTSVVKVNGSTRYHLEVPYTNGAQLDGNSSSTLVAFEVQGLPAQEQVCLETYADDPLHLHVHAAPPPPPLDLPRQVFIAFVRR